MIGPTVPPHSAGTPTSGPATPCLEVYNGHGRPPVLCAGCDKPIIERFLLNVLNRSWHTRCVQCIECKQVLTDRCFYKEGKIYCTDDFYRRFGAKCGGCALGISPTDMVRKARDKVFHLHCFTCMVCRKQLATGEELYVVDDNKFICKEDYLHSRYNQDSDGDDDELDKMDDNQSEKGSSFHDDDSIDSGLPSLDLSGTVGGGLHQSPFSSGVPLSSSSCGSTATQQSKTGALSPSGKKPGVTVKTEISTNDLNSNRNLSQPTSKASSPHYDGMPTLKTELDGSDTNDNSKLVPEDKENSKSDDSVKDEKESGDEGEKGGKEGGGQGTKRRGPRTTIKAKQLETLKAAFAATPKPTRHIREQLAQETGLNMRVIQVWFQNRRSKERRMKQLSALGARRAFFRNPRRLRGMGDEGELMGLGCGYFGDDFYPGPGFNPYPPGDYPFPPGHPDGPMPFLPPSSQGPPHMMEQMQGHLNGPDPTFILPPGDMLPPSSQPSDVGLPPPLQTLEAFGNMPPRSMPGGFQDGPMGPDGPRQDMPVGVWM